MENDNDNTHTHVVLAKGMTVSHYRIVEKIGAGGMGEVYLAQDTELDRKVAMKFLPPHLCRDEDCRKRFKREAQATARLSHPNIIHVYEVSEYEGRPFFAMELVEGQSLGELSKSEELSIERVIELGIRICDGLGMAHEKKVVHRDIKPSNIVIDTYGRPKILDFGLATIQGGEPLTKTGSTLGTVRYMSPEQAYGKKVDHRSDLFSLGVVLYELIAGRTPFDRDNETATLKAITQDIPEPLARYKSGVSDVLQRIISKLLEKDPSLRYQSATGVTSDLKMANRDRLPTGMKEVSPPSIAVLPFTNLSADPEQEYFCDGMAEEIINALTHIEGLHVVARTSCFAFKDKNEDVREIGRKLNVDHVLEGSVRKAGNRIRITGQLIKISDGYHLWSEKYDRDLKDIFEIQDEISWAIAENLNAKLLGLKEARTINQHTTNFDAYGLYLRGRWLFDQRTEHSIRASIDCYTQAIEKDPDFAPAFVGLSYAYCELPQFSSFPQKDALAKARKATEKALAIDDRYSEAHTALGVIQAEFDWDWAKAEAEYATAIELNTASAETRFWYSLLLLYLGRMDDAIRQMKLAQELDPLSLAINKYFGLIYLCAGRHEAAEKTLENSIKLAPSMTYLHAMLGLLYIDKEMFTEALSEFQEEEKNDKEVPSMIMAWKCIALVAEGRMSEVQDILERLVEKHRENRASPYAVATVYFALGDRNRGFEWLSRAVEERDYWLRYLKVDPTMRNKRDDPLLRKLLAGINLEWRTLRDIVIIYNRPSRIGLWQEAITICRNEASLLVPQRESGVQSSTFGLLASKSNCGYCPPQRPLPHPRINLSRRYLSMARCALNQPPVWGSRFVGCGPGTLKIC